MRRRRPARALSASNSARSAARSSPAGARHGVSSGTARRAAPDRRSSTARCPQHPRRRRRGVARHSLPCPPRATRRRRAEHRLPGAPVEVRADPERRQPVVASPRHALADAAEQQVDQITLAEALAGAADRRQCLLGGDGAVPGRDRLEAGVAVAAGRRQGFPEVLQEDLAAYTCLVAEQRAQLVLLDAPSLSLSPAAMSCN